MKAISQIIFQLPCLTDLIAGIEQAELMPALDREAYLRDFAIRQGIRFADLEKIAHAWRTQP